MPGTSPGTTPVRRLETIPGISTHLANAGVQPRPWLPRSLSLRHVPGEATKLRFAPTSRPSTSFYVERLYVAGAEFRPRPGDLRLHQGCPDRPTKDVDARDKPGHDAGRAIGNHSRDIDASRKLGSATATGLPRSLTVMAGHRPGHPRPSTSRGCVLPARSSDRVFQRPTTSPTGPQTGRQRTWMAGTMPGHDRESDKLSHVGHASYGPARQRSFASRRRPGRPRPFRVIVPYSLFRSGLPARMSLGFLLRTSHWCVAKLAIGTLSECCEPETGEKGRMR